MNLVFTINDKELACQAARLGVTEFMLDFENKISLDGISREKYSHEFVASLRSINPRSRIIMRVPKRQPGSLEDVLWAFEHGADEVLVPGLHSVGQVKNLFSVAPRDRSISIVIETLPLMSELVHVLEQPCYRFHFGLIDLAHEVGLPSPLNLISHPLLENAIKMMKSDLLFGFLSVSPPEQALQISPSYILEYMKARGVGYAFLGRSFSQAVESIGLAQSLASLTNSIELSPFEFQEIDSERSRSASAQSPRID
jgi:hypothetical protein